MRAVAALSLTPFVLTLCTLVLLWAGSGLVAAATAPGTAPQVLAVHAPRP